ncbi:methyl-accepting chemotaxis protein [Chromatiaceae bacterium AAb-1]|nr:methyl-accepting chemotaxis protein [Chromatiaceae bacterium AAb-1]
MSQPKSRIAWQLASILALLFVVLISASTLVSLRSLDNANFRTQQAHLASEARLLAAQMETFLGSLRQSTQRLANLFEQRFAQGLELRRDERVAVGELNPPALYIADQLLNGHFAQVDEFRQLTDGVATVFVRDGEDFVRIATSLTQQDGSRAIGTRLDRQHPAYARLLARENYIGRAVLFGRFYMTQYTPVRDASGEVFAVLFVGFDYTEEQSAQFDSLRTLRIGANGSLALLDENAHWLVPPAGLEQPEAFAENVQGWALDGQGRFWHDGRQDFFAVAAAVGGESWRVVAGMPKAEIREVTWTVGSELALGGILTLLAAVAAIIGLLRYKLRPLGELVYQAQALGDGNLSARLEVRSNDEIGDLAHHFNQMGNALRELIGGIGNSATQIASAAEQLSAVTEQTSAGVNGQKQETDQVATAMNEMAATVQEVARNAEEAASAAQAADSQARQGSQVLQRALDEVDRLSAQVNETAGAMNRLDSDSASIGTVLTVINGIAGQTNLLALNAAIEAARAGEAGRGFAVVADEVRSLAQRTQQSTAQIEELITNLQQGAQNAVKLMDSSRSLAASTLELSREASDELQAITRTVSTIQSMNLQIATASEEQSVVAEEINRSVLNVRDIADQSAAAAEETAAASAELARLGQGLQGLISRFRT